jgi:hypothetical protein
VLVQLLGRDLNQFPTMTASCGPKPLQKVRVCFDALIQIARSNPAAFTVPVNSSDDRIKANGPVTLAIQGGRHARYPVVHAIYAGVAFGVVKMLVPEITQESNPSRILHGVDNPNAGPYIGVIVPIACGPAPLTARR